MPATPLVRELRELHERYETIAQSWRADPPIAEQLTMMTEIVKQLEERAGAPPRLGSRRPTKPW
jgi:hypothetical protein